MSNAGDELRRTPQPDIHSSRVLILDFGAQYTQLIARRVRELGVYCEILPWDVSNDDVRKWKPTRHHPLGRARIRHRPGAAARAAGGVRARRARARHLLRHADHGAAARRPRGAQQSPRIRLRRSHQRRAEQAARRVVRSPGRAGPRGARRMDEPRRPRRVAAAGIHRGGAERQRAAGGDGRRVAAFLRRAVPSRSHAHAAGQASARALRARDLRLRAAVERRQHHRRRDRARARAGGQGQGAAGSVRRRGFLGGRGAAAPGHRRSAGLRVRRSRPAAPQRRRRRHEDLRRRTSA